MNELQIVFQIQELFLSSPLLIALAIFAARYLLAVFFVLGAFLFYSRRKHEKHAAMEALWAVLFALLIVNVIGRFVDRLRPYQESWIHGPTIPILIPQPLTSSFPSGHTAASFALAAAIYWGNKKLGVIAFIVATIIAFSRIIIGVHYPSDVAVGVLIGFVGFLLIRYIHLKLRLKGK